jgi:hypothetical protein
MIPARLRFCSILPRKASGEWMLSAISFMLTRLFSWELCAIKKTARSPYSHVLEKIPIIFLLFANVQNQK